MTIALIEFVERGGVFSRAQAEAVMEELLSGAYETPVIMRLLVAMDMASLTTEDSARRRRLFLLATIVCCLVLAAWICILAVTLPAYYRAGGWRGAWVGFDVGS